MTPCDVARALSASPYAKGLSSLVAAYGGLGAIIVRPYFSSAAKTRIVRSGTGVVRVGNAITFNIQAEVGRCRVTLPNPNWNRLKLSA